jgi:hypothetical protein
MKKGRSNRTLLIGSMALVLALALVFAIALPISGLAKSQEQSTLRKTTPAGAWESIPVTTSGIAVQGRAMTLDASGTPQITYITTDQVLHYSSWDGSAWTSETVATGVTPAPGIIVQDPAGVLHIAFMKPGPEVWYATRSGGVWNTEKVEDVAINPWLAFDQAGHPYILFQDDRPLPPDGGGWGLVLYTRSGGAWTHETVALRKCGSDCAYMLVIDKTDKIHISYADDGTIRYIYKDGGNWITEPVSASGLVPWLAADGSGVPKMAYTLPGPDVMLAERSGGARWTSSLVDGDMVALPSIAFDRFDNVHLAYCDQRPVPPNGPGYGLKYAFKTATGWSIQEVDGMTACNTAWLALDKTGNPSILYYDTANLQLKYAQWKATVTSQAIPTSGGSLTSGVDQTAYTFPPATFSAPVTVTHTPLFGGSQPAAPELFGTGHGFEVEATYTNSGNPAELAPGKTYSLTIHYIHPELGMVDESSLALYYWNGNAWVAEPSSLLDTTANSVSSTPNHFGIWAVLGETHSIFLPVVFR